MCSPVAFSTVCTVNAGPPRSYAALSLLCAAACWRPWESLYAGIRTYESRGNEIRVALSLPADRCSTIIVSLRRPAALAEVAPPTCSAAISSADSPARLSEPTSSQFCAAPVSAPVTQSAQRPGWLS